ncbi:MAG: hypothetical protein DCC58_20545 [Chloroflexi bacterium]|nr:MAG: hypothetical protein DCC58_20545 [Chloroflexota bacterium]
MKKGLVIAEARESWEQLQVNGRPAVVFPSGRQVSDLGLPRVRPVEGRVARLAPPPCSGQECRDLLLEILTTELDA